MLSLKKIVKAVQRKLSSRKAQESKQPSVEEKPCSKLRLIFHKNPKVSTVTPVMAARPTHVASATITQPAAIASPTPNHPTVIVANVETPQTDLKLSRYLPCRPIVPITRSRPALPIHFRPHNVRPQDPIKAAYIKTLISLKNKYESVQLENKNLEKRLHEAEQTEAMMHMKARQRKTKLEASDAEVSEMRGRVEEGDHRVMVLESLLRECERNRRTTADELRAARERIEQFNAAFDDTTAMIQQGIEKHQAARSVFELGGSFEYITSTKPYEATYRHRLVLLGEEDDQDIAPIQGATNENHRRSRTSSQDSASTTSTLIDTSRAATEDRTWANFQENKEVDGKWIQEWS